MAKGTFHLSGLYRLTSPHCPPTPLVSNPHSTFTQYSFSCVFTIFFQGHRSRWIKGPLFSSMTTSKLIAFARLCFQIMPHSDVLGVRSLTYLFWKCNSTHRTLQVAPVIQERPVHHQKLNLEALPLYFLYFPWTSQRPLLQRQSSCSLCLRIYIKPPVGPNCEGLEAGLWAQRHTFQPLAGTPGRREPVSVPTPPEHWNVESFLYWSRFYFYTPLGMFPFTKHWYRFSDCKLERSDKLSEPDLHFTKPQAPAGVISFERVRARTKVILLVLAPSARGLASGFAVRSVVAGTSTFCHRFKLKVKKSRQDYRQWPNVDMLSDIQEGTRLLWLPPEKTVTYVGFISGLLESLSLVALLGEQYSRVFIIRFNCY